MITINQTADHADYLDDDAFLTLQNLLMKNPTAGDLIPDSGGLRKLRVADIRRGKRRFVQYFDVTYGR